MHTNRKAIQNAACREKQLAESELQGAMRHVSVDCRARQRCWLSSILRQALVVLSFD